MTENLKAKNKADWIEFKLIVASYHSFWCFSAALGYFCNCSGFFLFN